MKTGLPITIGLDLFGYGNIGDDIMISGFARGLKELGLDRRCVYGPRTSDPASQRLRCPEILWDTICPTPRSSCIWAAVGDTPFQATWGDQVLRVLVARKDEIGAHARKIMVCAGAESEMLPWAGAHKPVAALFDRISTRDDHSYGIITGAVGVPKERVLPAADLANISLAYLFKDRKPERRYPLGTVLMADTLSREDVRVFASFVDGEGAPTSFIAGDVRSIPLHEVYVYRELRQEGYLPNAELSVPPYRTGSVEDLVRPISECETLVSSRYHCLLAAAWAGCRVAIVGRSSKLTALARVLSVPCATLPLTLERLNEIRRDACVVPRETLSDLRERALEGIRFCLTD